MDDTSALQDLFILGFFQRMQEISWFYLIIRLATKYPRLLPLGSHRLKIYSSIL